jgi:hypothetical protein
LKKIQKNKEKNIIPIIRDNNKKNGISNIAVVVSVDVDTVVVEK